MRQLQEYKAEIFRRSREKQRKIRRNRRIALGVGIPLCLCAVLTLTLPGHLLSAKDKAAPEMAPDLEMPMESPKLQLTVRYQGRELLVTDPDEAAQLEQLLRDWPTDAADQEDGKYAAVGTPLPENGSSGLADSVQPEEWSITLHREGETAVYRITGDWLCNTATGQSRRLTPQEQALLEALLTP
jgi:hypothetical protein